MNTVRYIARCKACGWGRNRAPIDIDTDRMRSEAIAEGQSVDGHTCAACGNQLEDMGAHGLACPTCEVSS